MLFLCDTEPFRVAKELRRIGEELRRVATEEFRVAKKLLRVAKEPCRIAKELCRVATEEFLRDTELFRAAVITSGPAVIAVLRTLRAGSEPRGVSPRPVSRLTANTRGRSVPPPGPAAYAARL
jgi:hypothetical protein